MRTYDDLIDDWHVLPESDTRTLAEYLAMTPEEYEDFVQNPGVFSVEAPMCEAATDGECRWNKCPVKRGCDRDCPLK